MSHLNHQVVRIFIGIRDFLLTINTVLFGGILGLFVVIFAGYSPYAEHVVFSIYVFIVFVAFVIGVRAALFVTFLITSFFFVFEMYGNTDVPLTISQKSLLIAFFGLIVIVIADWSRRQFRLIRARERYYSALVENSIHPIFLKNREGTILYVSKSVSRLFGYMPHELTGKTIESLVHPDDKKQIADFHAKIILNGNTSHAIETRIKHMNGEYIWMRNEAVNLLQNGDIAAIMSSFQDISARKHADIERQKNLQNERILRTIAEEAVRTRDEFLSVASHELKTPLATVLLQLQSNLRRILTQSLANFSGEKMVKSLTMAEQQCQRMGILMEDLVNFSQITTGRIKFQKEKGNINEMIESVIARLAPEAQQAGCAIVFNPKETIIGTFDIVRIEQCVINLVSNAIKYGNGKDVKITTEKRGEDAIIHVIDQGYGIDPAHHQKIFEPFKRACKEHIRGLGVGLYITRQIITAHGGDVSVSSKKGAGSTFTLRFNV